MQGVRYEHGDYYDLFNAADPSGFRPLGYYVARSVTESEYGGSSMSDTTRWLCLLLVNYFGSITIGALKASSVAQRMIKFVLDQGLKGDGRLIELSKKQNDWITGGCFYKEPESDVQLVSVLRYC